jgi:hypothetical protein
VVKGKAKREEEGVAELKKIQLPSICIQNLSRIFLIVFCFRRVLGLGVEVFVRAGWCSTTILWA